MNPLKKSLPDLAANLVRTPTPGTAYAAYPLTDERPPEERPPWEPRTRFEVERDIAQLRSVQRTLGSSVSWIVDTLLLDEDADQADERAKKVRESKREALEALAYVRDLLISGGTDVDEERLMSEEEFKKRRQHAATSMDEPKSSFNENIISPPPVSKSAAPIPGAIAPRPRAVASHTVVPPPPSSSFDSPRLGGSTGSRTTASSATPVVQERKPRAPWNHTSSNFSPPLGGFSAEVPSLAPLPKASTGLTPPAAAVQNSQPTQMLPSRLHDPLGVLP